MAVEIKVAMIGAGATVIAAAVAGYFSVAAGRASQDAQTSSTQAASSSTQAASSSSQAVTASASAAVGAVDEGYDTTVKPLLEQTDKLIGTLETRIDVMQREIDTLRSTIAASTHVALPQPAPVPTSTGPRRLAVPDSVRFKSESFTRFQRQAAPR